uniref:Uncharacterized protein n=1 Tax=Hucho hucho TaxID=62062 RepID=A0A4W5KLD4_9TELE
MKWVKQYGNLHPLSTVQVNIVSIGTVATEIQSALADNILATGVMATLLAADGVYFPYEEEFNHRLVRDIGNVTKAVEITFQFACKPDRVEDIMRRARLPFQLQLSFTTRDQQKVTRIITEQRRVTTSSWVWAGSLNMSVLGVHCAQLCARLTMEGRVHEAQRQLRAQQNLLKDISEQRPIPKEESIYGNWISTMTTICDDLITDSQVINQSINHSMSVCPSRNLINVLLPEVKGRDSFHHKERERERQKYRYYRDRITQVTGY